MRLSICGLTLALLSVAAGAQAQNADEIFGDRSLAMALDDRCGFFSDAQRSALEAARHQARGVLLRVGVTAQRLDEYSDQIGANAAEVACDAAEPIEIRNRVVSAFEGYRLIPSMSFPGETYGWEANRLALLEDTSWVILQDKSDLRVGVAMIGGEVALTVVPLSDTQYTSAILVMRDPVREPDLYDPTAGGLFNGPADAPWARWTPPAYARRTAWANDRVQGDAVLELAGMESAGLFRFPESAALALAEQDPREAARIDFLDRRGNLAASSYIEIGDFAAAAAFIEAVIPPDPDI
jgi:hypothetical protein